MYDRSSSYVKPMVSVLLTVLLAVLFLFCGVRQTYAQSLKADGRPITQSFVIEHIVVRGALRIKQDTVKHYLPLRVGQTFYVGKTPEVMQRFYDSGFFEHVTFLKGENNTLIVQIVERSIINDIYVTGYKEISEDEISKLRNDLELTSGRIFDEAKLKEFTTTLRQRYRQMNYYSAQIDVKIIPIKQGKVSIKVSVNEGSLAKVHRIRIIGNHAFSERRLLKQMSLARTNLFSFFTHHDRYSEDSLENGIEQLRHYYFDHGFLNMHILKKKARIFSKKHLVDIDIYISEGSVYYLEKIRWHGDVLGQQAVLQEKLGVKLGAYFSRSTLMQGLSKVKQHLANQGYASADVAVDLKPNRKTHKVDLGLTVKPGKRVNVRFIRFVGHYITKDGVLRRMVPQMEGTVFSLSKIQTGQARLQNAKYLESIELETKEVPGHKDEIDLIYNIKERQATLASANFQVGYSDVAGFQYNVGLSQDNFLGSGNTVSVSFNRSGYEKSYLFSHAAHYLTNSGVSRYFKVYFREQTPGKVNITRYSTNAYGTSLQYGLPLAEACRLYLGGGFEHIKLTTGGAASQEIKQFVSDYGDNYNLFKLITGISYDSYDRGFLPTQGIAHNLDLEVGLPFGQHSLDYYRATYHLTGYHRLWSSNPNWVAYLSTDLGYGRGYARQGSQLPFFKNFYGGGLTSLPGYRGNSLGPLDSRGQSIGGNVSMFARFGLIFPHPLGDRVRAMLFAGIGNVYKDEVKLSELRSSAGLLVEWQSLLPLEFSLAVPLNHHNGDRLQTFDFAIAAHF